MKTKNCQTCQTPTQTAYRIQTHKSKLWIFVCEGCLRIHQKEANYRYGGTWKGYRHWRNFLDRSCVWMACALLYPSLFWPLAGAAAPNRQKQWQNKIVTPLLAAVPQPTWLSQNLSILNSTLAWRSSMWVIPCVPGAGAYPKNSPNSKRTKKQVGDNSK